MGQQVLKVELELQDHQEGHLERLERLDQLGHQDQPAAQVQQALPVFQDLLATWERQECLEYKVSQDPWVAQEVVDQWDPQVLEVAPQVLQEPPGDLDPQGVPLVILERREHLEVPE